MPLSLVFRQRQKIRLQAGCGGRAVGTWISSSLVPQNCWTSTFGGDVASSACFADKASAEDASGKQVHCLSAAAAGASSVQWHALGQKIVVGMGSLPAHGICMNHQIALMLACRFCNELALPSQKQHCKLRGAVVLGRLDRLGAVRGGHEAGWFLT